MTSQVNLPVSPLRELLPESIESLPTVAASSHLSMPLPPEAIYKSKEDLYVSIQTWAVHHHFAFRTERSTKIRNGVCTRAVFSCDRAGKVQPASNLQNDSQDHTRRVGTRKTGCQFSIIAIERRDTQWELRHRDGKEYGIHNHPPSQSITSHPAYRKFVQAEIERSKQLAKQEIQA